MHHRDRAIVSARIRNAPRRLGRGVVAGLCAAALAACSGPSPPAEDAAPASRPHEVHVVSHGWHTGLVIGRAALADSGRLPETADFPRARLLEFGWGDRAYYMAPEKTAGMTLAAALRPTPSVMHVAAVGSPAPAEASGRAIRLRLSERSLRRLIEALSASFDRPAAGAAAAPIARGLGADSRFYPARGRFHLLNNCNAWTARMLAAAGLEVSPEGVVTAGTLMRRVRAAKARAPD